MSFGRVKFFNRKLRYGIIIPDGVKPHDREHQVFFYENIVPKGGIADGAEVEFELIPGYPDKKAMSVKVVGFSYAAD